MKNAYAYDFRVWSLPEIKEALLDVGFTQVNLWVSFTRTDQNNVAIDPDDFKRIDWSDKVFISGGKSWNAYITAHF